MGQNIRAIEDVVVSLQNSRLITPRQAQSFMKDYQEKHQNIEEVKRFIENPNLTSFLKYYINYKYGLMKKSNQKQKARHSSRKQLQAEFISIAQKELKNIISTQYKKIHLNIQSSLKLICDTVIEQNVDELRKLIREILKKSLNIDSYKIITKHNEQFTSYHSQFDLLKTIDKNNVQYTQYYKMFSKTGSIIQNKDKSIKFINGNWQFQYIFQLEINDQATMANYMGLKQKQLTLQNLYAVIIQLSKFYIAGNFVKCHEKQLFNFCLLALNIVNFGTKIHEQLIKMLIVRTINVVQNSTSLSVSSIVSKIMQYNQEKHDLSPSILIQISKLQEKLNKEKQKIKCYTDLIQNKSMFIDFNKYSEVKFCFISSSNSMFRKLKSCWRHKRTKIIDIMGQNQLFINKFTQISKCAPKSEILQYKFEQFSSFFYTSINMTIQRVYILFNMKFQHAAHESQDLTINLTVDDMESSRLTSIHQQKLVKKMQREDPNIRKTGWLKLFIKQQAQQIQKNKQNITWHSKHVQKIEHINKCSLNVLNMSDKQIYSLVVSIMKSNSTFNSLVDNEQSYAKFNNFLLQIKHNYSLIKNQFHNFAHAGKMLHMCFLICNTQKMQRYLSNHQILSVLLSGLCHDVGYSGYNDQFQIATSSQRALTFNDILPNQNYQASITFQILKKSSNNFMHKMERQKFMALKQNVIHNIVNTGPKQHTLLLSKFKEWMNLPFQQALKDSNTLTATIVQTSYFGGSCKEFQISKQWSYRINSEFQKQYELQQKLGLNIITPIFDLNNICMWADNQCHYLKTTVLPYFQQISQFCDGEKQLQNAVSNVKSNIKAWQKLKLSEETKKEQK